MRPPAQQDIEQFCYTHWLRLCGIAHRRGLDEQDAQDAVQDLFMHLLQRDQLDLVMGLSSTDHQTAFLSTRLNWHLSKRRRDQHRLRRGGGYAFVSLADDTTATAEPAHHLTPVWQLSVIWLHEVLDSAFTRLRSEMKPAAWAELEPALCDTDAERPAQTTAHRVALHRARHRLRDIICAEVSPLGRSENVAQLLCSMLVPDASP